MAAWLMLARSAGTPIGAGGGDDPAAHYHWDSTVPNHAAVRVGDVIALWDGTELVGLSVIDDITLGTVETRTPYCLKCGKTDLSPRRERLPLFKCWNDACQHVSAEAGWKRKTVVTYRSHHGSAWAPARGVLTADRLRALCVQPYSRKTMRELRWTEFAKALGTGSEPLRTINAARRSVQTDNGTAPA